MESQRGVLRPKLQELGRIRIGDQTEITSGRNKGRKRPRRLETFRLTSQNKPLLHAAARLYGGEVEAWEDAPNGRQWQVITQANWLPVTVPPFQVISQSYEQWSGGGCKIRCDGECVMQAENRSLEGKKCICPADPEERNAAAAKGEACHAVTRLNVLLHELPGIGVWRVDTRGYYAGSELMGIVPFLESTSANGLYLKCALRLETRKALRRGETRTFPVVTLQPTEVTMQQLLTQNIGTESLIAPPQIPLQIEAPGSPEMGEEDPINLLYGDDPKAQGTGTQDATEGMNEAEPVEEVQGELVPDGDGPTLDEAQERLRLRADVETAMRGRGMSINAVANLVAECGGGDTPFSDLKDVHILRAMARCLFPDGDRELML